MFYNERMLPPSLVSQIETAIDLLRDEGGHGEVALVLTDGELKHVERRPRIRMHVDRVAQGPPRRDNIVCRTKTG